MARLNFNKKPQKKTEPHHYFQSAQSWCDDYYTTAVASRNRWRAFSLVGLMPLLGLSLIAIALLVPAQRLEPILINHYSDGVISVLPAKALAPPVNSAETESDIVRYIENRESYSAFAYPTQYRLVLLLSGAKVAKTYAKEQTSANTSAPVNVLGDSGTKTVHVDSVLFLDSRTKNNPVQHIASHQNLAQVNFSVTTTKNGNPTTVPYTALISWRYQGTPQDPSAAWLNWNGFTVTEYQVQRQNAPFTGTQ